MFIYVMWLAFIYVCSLVFLIPIVEYIFMYIPMVIHILLLHQWLLLLCHCSLSLNISSKLPLQWKPFQKMILPNHAAWLLLLATSPGWPILLGRLRSLDPVSVMFWNSFEIIMWSFSLFFFFSYWLLDMFNVNLYW